MMHYLKNAMLAAMLFCGCYFVGGIDAQAAPDNQPYPQGYNVPQGYQQVTPEQWAEAQKIFSQNYTDMEATRQELALKRQLLDSQLASPNPDSDQIEKLSQEIGVLRGKMLRSRVDARNRLAERGLPTDCYGPCGYDYGYGMMGMGMMGPYYGGWGHHGRGHGGYGPCGRWGW